MSKRLASVLAVMLGMLVFAAVASAEPKVDSSQRLRVQIDAQAGCASVDSIAGWVTGQDSPSDSNQRLFHTNIGDVGGCVLLFSNASVNRCPLVTVVLGMVPTCASTVLASSARPLAIVASSGS